MQCTSCLKEKTPDCFYFYRGRYRRNCLECHKKWCRANYVKNKKKMYEQSRIYKKNNPEKNRQWQKDYVLRYPERQLARGRLWRLTQSGIKSRRATYKRCNDKHPEKRQARNALNYAIYSGKIKRMPCSQCGVKAEAHHEDYSKPLEVLWLCKRHHQQHHQQHSRSVA